MKWTSSLLNFFYPNRCPACDRILTAHELLCKPCSDALPLSQEQYCRICGKPDCMCRQTALSYDGAVVCSAYTEGTVRAILQLKQSRNTNFAIFAARILAERLHEEHLQFDCVIPVPMHRSKERMRGYNQATLIAKEIARILELPLYEDILIKHRSAVSQHELTADERAAHLDSFGITAQRLDGLRILLCDDVLTTGNTLNRCAALLKENGAASVYAAVAATTIRKNRRKEL